MPECVKCRVTFPKGKMTWTTDRTWICNACLREVMQARAKGTFPCSVLAPSGDFDSMYVDATSMQGGASGALFRVTARVKDGCLTIEGAPAGVMPGPYALDPRGHVTTEILRLRTRLSTLIWQSIGIGAAVTLIGTLGFLKSSEKTQTFTFGQGFFISLLGALLLAMPIRFVYGLFTRNSTAFELRLPGTDSLVPRLFATTTAERDRALEVIREALTPPPPSRAASESRASADSIRI